MCDKYTVSKSISNIRANIMNKLPKKRKLTNMDVDQTAKDGNMEWNLFFQNALQADPKLEYKENNPCYIYSENGIDIEVTEREKHRYVSFLRQIPQVYKKVKCWPNAQQKMLILALAAYVSHNERIFVKINEVNTYNCLVKMAEVSKDTTDCLVKVRYLDMLCSFFEHDAGLRWSLETNHWANIYGLVVECQNGGCDIDEKLYSILSKFLQKTSRTAPKICVQVITQMVQGIINIAHKNFHKTKKEPLGLLSSMHYQSLALNLRCLVEILERLLASPSTDILKYFNKMQVREASDILAILSNDSELSLQVNRVMIILSFYEMTELFDGIKVVNHDPIALSGFLRIVERELKKHHLKTIFELFYHAQKYWINVSRKMPQYFLKGKPVDIEDELMSFQVEPLVIIAEKLIGVPQTSEEELRKCYLADVLNVYSEDGLQLGYEIREQINKEPLEIEITALKCIKKTKPIYSRRNLAAVFQSLTYSLKDFITYIKRRRDPEELDQSFAETLLETILVYLDNFDLSWRESIGSVELTNLVYEFLFYSSEWSSEVILKALKTLNITISKNMSPNMALLVDTTQCSSLNELGTMLFSKCLNSNAEVRNAALSVVCTMYQKVNEGFLSFKKLLADFVTKDLIITMAMNDPDKSVKATALRCIQEMLTIEDIGSSFLKGGFVDRILQLVSREQEPMVIREVITLIGQIYQSDLNGDEDNFKIYNVMIQVALREQNPDVQEQAVKFWDHVTRKYLEKQGMTDDVFPAVIFSKEHKKIIRMDDREIRKRLSQTLDNISKSGCFSVFQQILQNENTPKQVFSTTVAIVTKLLRLLQRYEVTPEFIILNQTYPNLWSIPRNIIQSPSAMDEDDECMQEIIHETLMEMLNSNMPLNIATSPSVSNSETGECVQDKSNESSSSSSTGQVSTVDFMDFIYRKLPFLTN